VNPNDNQSPQDLRAHAENVGYEGAMMTEDNEGDLLARVLEENLCSVDSKVRLFPCKGRQHSYMWVYRYIF
jgi:hypothetical protein